MLFLFPNETIPLASAFQYVALRQCKTAFIILERAFFMPVYNMLILKDIVVFECVVA
jgi:hypothetical protein